MKRAKHEESVARGKCNMGNAKHENSATRKKVPHENSAA